MRRGITIRLAVSPPPYTATSSPVLGTMLHAAEQRGVERQAGAPEIAEHVRARVELPRRGIGRAIEQPRVEPQRDRGDRAARREPVVRTDRHDERDAEHAAGDERGHDRDRHVEERHRDQAPADGGEPRADHAPQLVGLDPPEPGERREHHRHRGDDERAPREATTSNHVALAPVNARISAAPPASASQIAAWRSAARSRLLTNGTASTAAASAIASSTAIGDGGATATSARSSRVERASRCN